jgi:YfiH family protein
MAGAAGPAVAGSMSRDRPGPAGRSNPPATLRDAEAAGLVWRPGPPETAGPDPAWPPVLVAEDLLGAGVVAAFTGRTGGSSAPPYASLNLGLAVGDDLRRVLANRRRVATVLGLAGHPWALARQVHGATILRVGTGGQGAGTPGADGPWVEAGGQGAGPAGDDGPWVEAGAFGQGPPEGKAPLGEADGLVTTEAGVVLAVLTADCAPVLLADAAARVVGAVHAGWRGLAAGVVEAGVAALAGLGADPAATVGLVGPAAGGCCYEVGPDVREAVGARYPAALATTRDGRPALDPAAAAAQALERAGIGRLRVAGECTVDLADRHFSHRRDHGRTGRQAGLIALVPGAGR